MPRIGPTSRAALFLGIAAILGIATLLAISDPAFSQEGEPAPQESSAQEEAGDSLGGLIVKSGAVGIVFYIILGIFSVAGLAVALERLFNLKRNKVIPRGLVSRLRDLVARDAATPSSMRQLCDAHPSPTANVLRAGLMRIGRPLPEIEKAMEDTASRELASLRGRHKFLSVIATVAPLVGLLGTVVGMIFAFRTAAQMEIGRGEQLSEGIYLALMTTAAGLSIAIPSLLLVAWFNSRVDRYMWEMDEELMNALPALDGMEGLSGASTPHREKAEVAV